MENRIFCVHQKIITSSGPMYRVYDGKNKTFKLTPQENAELKCNFRCYGSTKKELKAFHRQFREDSIELSRYLRINRLPFFVHTFTRLGSAIRFVFTQLAGNSIPQDIEPLDPQEYYWMQDCHNTSIIFGEEKCEGDFYGYDFQQFFPALLAGAHKTKMYIPCLSCAFRSAWPERSPTLLGGGDGFVVVGMAAAPRGGCVGVCV